MKPLRKFFTGLLVTGVILVISCPAMAEIYDLCGKQLSLDGYFRQEFAFTATDASTYRTNQPGLNSAYQIWYLETAFEPTQNLEARMILRLWGDMIYAFKHKSNYFQEHFGKSRKGMMWDTDFKDIFREFHITYTTPRFLIKLGKQQIGWGEADGLRVLDVINPLDARRTFQFYDTEGYEEVRIPKWMIKTEFFTGGFGIFNDSSVEVIWNPGDIEVWRESLPTVADTYKVGGIFVPGEYPKDVPNSWGPWGVPTTFVPLPVRFRKEAPSNCIDNSEYGGRIKLSFWETYLTLNYWNGFQTDGLVLKYRGIEMDPQNGFQSPIPGMPPFPAILIMEKQWRRMQVAGFTVNRELFGVGKATGQVANPVLRIEALYDFDHWFNTANTPLPFDALVLKKYDQIRYMVGFDWSMNIPFFNPHKSTFVSGQFFHIITPNWKGEPNAPRPVPLYQWYFPKNQFYTSLLMKTDYFNERVTPTILTVWDFHCQAAWIKSKIDFKYGDHWRPQIGYLWIKANNSIWQNLGPGVPIRIRDNYKSFGIFEDRDQVWMRIQYQF